METTIIVLAIGIVVQSLIVTLHSLDIIEKTICKITRKIK